MAYLPDVPVLLDPPKIDLVRSPHQAVAYLSRHQACSTWLRKIDFRYAQQRFLNCYLLSKNLRFHF